MTTRTNVEVKEGDVLKEEDTAPNLRAVLVEQDIGTQITLSVSGSYSSPADPVDLTGSNVVLNVVDSDGTLVIDSASVTIDDTANGEVVYDWSATDLTSADTYEAEFEETKDNGEVITYPNTGNFTIDVNEQLG